MKKFWFSLLPVLLLLISSCPVCANDVEYVEGEVLIVINDSSYAYSAKTPYGSKSYSEALSSMAASFAESTGLVSLGTFSDISKISGSNIIHLKSETKSTEQLIQELENNPVVKSVQPNYIRLPLKAPASTGSFINSAQDVVPDDPRYRDLWGMSNIGMPQVWEYNTGSESVCVALMDSGVDYNHQDLNANMARDSFGNYGRRFKRGVQSDNPMDINGHGTHVAGIVGAVGNNGIGVTGINWRVKMLAVNVMPDNVALEADIIAGINYILSEKSKGLNIRVVNMSFGGWEKPIPDGSPLGSAIKSLSDAGIICTIAAGNESQNISSPNGIYLGELIYPACFRFANTIAVGSINSSNAKSAFSNYSSTWVHIAAPGEDILSTLPNNSYGLMGGTSMAAPYVAGAAAFLFAAFPGETAGQIKERILSGARNIGVSEGYWGSGLLNVADAYGRSPGSEQDQPMTSVMITGEDNILIGDSAFLSNTKSPSNANGSFEYSWYTSNDSVVKISESNTSSVEITGYSEGSSTITLSVTQTLPSGAKVTMSDSVDISVTTTSRRSGSSSSGCNAGLFSAVLLLLALPVLMTGKR